MLLEHPESCTQPPGRLADDLDIDPTPGSAPPTKGGPPPRKEARPVATDVERIMDPSKRPKVNVASCYVLTCSFPFSFLALAGRAARSYGGLRFAGASRLVHSRTHYHAQRVLRHLRPAARVRYVVVGVSLAGGTDDWRDCAGNMLKPAVCSRE